MQFLQLYACDQTTNAILGGATVSVFSKGTDDLATIYAADGETEIGNPLFAGNNGEYGFAAANGDYDIQVNTQDPFRVYLVDPADIGADAAALAAAAAAGSAAGAAAAEAAVASGTSASTKSIGELTEETINAAIQLAQADAAQALSDVATANTSLTASVLSAQGQAVSALDQVAATTANLTVVSATVASNTATISSNYATLTTSISSLSGTITSLTATVNSNNTTVTANLTSEGVTRAAADSALSAQITTLTSNYSSLSATVSSNFTTLTTNNSALASDVTTLTAYATPNPNLLPDGALTLQAAGWTLSGFAWADDASIGPYVGGGYYTSSSTATSPAFSGAPNAAYTLSLDAGGTFPTATVYAFLIAYDSSHTQIGGAVITLTPASDVGYVRISGTGITPSLTAYLRFQFYANATISWALVKRIKVETGYTATLFSDDATPPVLNASINSESAVRATADSSLASQITTLQSNYSSLSATVSSNYTTLSNATSATAASVTSLTASVNPNPNLIIDPTYSNTFTDWTPLASEAETWNIGVDGGGRYAYTVTPSGTGQFTGYMSELFVFTGAYLTVSWAGYCNFPTGALYIDVEWLDSSQNHIQFSAAGGSGSQYAMTYATASWPTPRLSFTSTAPSGGFYARVRFYNENTTGTGACVIARIKAENGSIATIYTDDATATSIQASLSNEAVVRASADSALSSTTSSLSASIGSLSATVSSQSATLVTLQSQTATFLQQVSTSGGTAYIELASTSSGITAVLLQAANVYFGPNGYFNETNNTLEFNNGSVKRCLGSNFGTSYDLMEWYGSASIATSDATVANSIWAMRTNGVIYYGGTALGAGSVTGTGGTSNVNTLNSSSAWTTFGTASFGSIIAGGYWTAWASISISATSSPFYGSGGATSATGSGNWRIAEVSGSSVNVLASGTWSGTYNHSTGVCQFTYVNADGTTYTPGSGEADGGFSITLSKPTAAAYTGAETVLFQLNTPSGYIQTVGGNITSRWST